MGNKTTQPKKITTEQLLSVDMVQVKNSCKCSYVIVFNDGEVLMKSKEIILNRIIWEFFKEVNILSFSKKYDISNYYKAGLYNSKSALRMLEDMLEEVVVRYVVDSKDRSILNEKVYSLFYKVFLNINELIVLENVEYAGSINILDFLEIQFDSKLIGAMKKLEVNATPQAIKDTYDILDNIMVNEVRYENNPIRLGYVGQNFRIPQLQQLLGPIGFGSEVNNSIFTVPITRSYTLGLDNAYSVGVAGRDSMKACNALGEEVSTCEYMARTLQMQTSAMSNIVDGDCGSTRYKEWYIEPNNMTKLKEVVGKYHLDEKTKQVRPITMEDTHLLGKVVLLRHVNGCDHPSPRHVCFTCFGLQAVNYPYETRIGHATSAETTRINSQDTISTKHHVGTSMFVDYELQQGMERFIKTKGSVSKKKEENAMKNTKLCLRSDFFSKGKAKKMHFELVIDKESLLGLKDIGNVKNMKSINPANVSSIDAFYIIATNKDDKSTEYYDISIGMNTSTKSSKKRRVKRGFLTTRFLEFIVNDGEPKYKLDTTGKYYISLEGWDYEEPIFEIPLIQKNRMNFTSDMKEFINKMDVDDEGGYDRSLSSLSSMLNDAYGLPLCIAEIIASSFITTDCKNGDYSLGRGKSTEISKLRDIINHTSLGAMHGFERQKYTLFDEHTFGGNIVNHMLDGLICPAEVFAEEEERRAKFGQHYRRKTLKTISI